MQIFDAHVGERAALVFHDDGLALAGDGGGSFLVVVIGVLLGRGAAGGDDLFEGFFGDGFLDGGAGDEEEPVVAVVEMEEHLSAGAEDGGDSGFLHTAIVGIAFAHVGEERVTFLAEVGIFHVVAKLEGVVEVETDGLDDEFGQRVERDVTANGEFGGEVVVLDGEVVFLHSGAVDIDGESGGGGEEAEAEVRGMADGDGDAYSSVPNSTLGGCLQLCP